MHPVHHDAWNSCWLIGLSFLVLFAFMLILFYLLPNVRHPNVILGLDTVRRDRLGCCGHDVPNTPNIDALAKDSVVFTNVQAVSAWTTPTVGAIFTGYYPSEIGILNLDDIERGLAQSFTTLAEIFRGHQYTTTGIVSHSLISSNMRFDQGFEQYDEEATGIKTR